MSSSSSSSHYANNPNFTTTSLQVRGIEDISQLQRVQAPIENAADDLKKARDTNVQVTPQLGHIERFTGATAATFEALHNNIDRIMNNELKQTLLQAKQPYLEFVDLLLANSVNHTSRDEFIYTIDFFDDQLMDPKTNEKIKSTKDIDLRMLDNRVANPNDYEDPSGTPEFIPETSNEYFTDADIEILVRDLEYFNSISDLFARYQTSGFKAILPKLLRSYYDEAQIRLQKETILGSKWLYDQLAANLERIRSFVGPRISNFVATVGRTVYISAHMALSIFRDSLASLFEPVKQMLMGAFAQHIDLHLQETYAPQHAQLIGANIETYMERHQHNPQVEFNQIIDAFVRQFLLSCFNELVSIHLKEPVSKAATQMPNIEVFSKNLINSLMNDTQTEHQQQFQHMNAMFIGINPYGGADKGKKKERDAAEDDLPSLSDLFKRSSPVQRKKDTKDLYNNLLPTASMLNVMFSKLNTLKELAEQLKEGAPKWGMFDIHPIRTIAKDIKKALETQFMTPGSSSGDLGGANIINERYLKLISDRIDPKIKQLEEALEIIEARVTNLDEMRTQLEQAYRVHSRIVPFKKYDEIEYDQKRRKQIAEYQKELREWKKEKKTALNNNQPFTKPKPDNPFPIIADANEDIDTFQNQNQKNLDVMDTYIKFYDKQKDIQIKIKELITENIYLEERKGAIERKISEIRDADTAAKASINNFFIDIKKRLEKVTTARIEKEKKLENDFNLSKNLQPIRDEIAKYRRLIDDMSTHILEQHRESMMDKERNQIAKEFGYSNEYMVANKTVLDQRAKKRYDANINYKIMNSSIENAFKALNAATKLAEYAKERNEYIFKEDNDPDFNRLLSDEQKFEAYQSILASVYDVYYILYMIDHRIATNIINSDDIPGDILDTLTQDTTALVKDFLPMEGTSDYQKRLDNEELKKAQAKLEQKGLDDFFAARKLNKYFIYTPEDDDRYNTFLKLNTKLEPMELNFYATIFKPKAKGAIQTAVDNINLSARNNQYPLTTDLLIFSPYVNSNFAKYVMFIYDGTNLGNPVSVMRGFSSFAPPNMQVKAIASGQTRFQMQENGQFIEAVIYFFSSVQYDEAQGLLVYKPGSSKQPPTPWMMVQQRNLAILGQQFNLNGQAFGIEGVPMNPDPRQSQQQRDPISGRPTKRQRVTMHF